MDTWISYDEQAPTEVGFYEWRQEHKKGFVQIFCAKMRMRGNGYQSDVLSPEFDYWDGGRVHVPKGLQWRVPQDLAEAETSAKKRAVVIEGLTLRDCPFCGTAPAVFGSQCGKPGGGGGVTIAPAPENFNTWRVRQCCSLIGINGFASPESLGKAWNGGEGRHDP